MKRTWNAFVEQALKGEPDDVYVLQLRRMLADGHSVVSLNFESVSPTLRYCVVLARLRQLGTLVVPHSAAFLRWCLETGTRMSTQEEEEQRWAWVAHERFEPIASEYGEDYAYDVLLELLRALSPPRTVEIIDPQRGIPRANGPLKQRALRDVDRFLTDLVRDLRRPLRYSHEEVFALLDGALERFVRPQLERRFAPSWQEGTRFTP